MEDLKQALVQHLKQAGAFDARVADPRQGFENALPGRHPLDLWSECRSVIVYGVAMSTRTKYTYVGPLSPSPDPATMRFGYSARFGLERLAYLFLSGIAMWGLAFLEEHGGRMSAALSGAPGMERPTDPVQCKLCAYEAGLGVYGRSGLILHPELGNRMSIGTIFSDLPLPPDPKLEDFDPCGNCEACIKACPGQAFSVGVPYPQSWSEEKCQAAKKQLRDQGGLQCDACFAVCPRCRIPEEDLLLIEERPSAWESARRRN
jgi:ferredoxin